MVLSSTDFRSRLVANHIFPLDQKLDGDLSISNVHRTNSNGRRAVPCLLSGIELRGGYTVTAGKVNAEP
jgi:hypothetical protein